MSSSDRSPVVHASPIHAVDPTDLIVLVNVGRSDACDDPHLHNFRAMRTGYAVSWPMRYGVPWIWAGSRAAAELYTFKQLEKFWKEKQEALKKGNGVANVKAP